MLIRFLRAYILLRTNRQKISCLERDTYDKGEYFGKRETIMYRVRSQREYSIYSERLAHNKGKGEYRMTQVIVKSTTPSNVKHLLQVALDHELRVLKIGIEKTRHNLHQFEQQFGMESEHFYQEFQTGNIGEDRKSVV